MKGENFQSPYPRGPQGGSLEEFETILETLRRSNWAAMCYLMAMFSLPIGVLIGMVVAPNNEEVQAGVMIACYVLAILTFIGLTIWTAVAGHKFIGVPPALAGSLAGMLSCIPCVPVIFLIWIQLKLTGVLKKEYGIKMGLFAPKKDHVEEARSRLHKKKMVQGDPPQN